MTTPIYERAIAEVEQQFDLARDYATSARTIADTLLNTLATFASTIDGIDTTVILESTDYDVTPFTAEKPDAPDTTMSLITLTYQI